MKKFNRKERLRKVSGEVTLNAMLQLNELNLEMCKASIKEKHPEISDKELLVELNKIYWKNGRT